MVVDPDSAHHETPVAGAGPGPGDPNVPEAAIHRQRAPARCVRPAGPVHGRAESVVSAGRGRQESPGLWQWQPVRRRNIGPAGSAGSARCGRVESVVSPGAASWSYIAAARQHAGCNCTGVLFVEWPSGLVLFVNGLVWVRPPCWSLEDTSTRTDHCVFHLDPVHGTSVHRHTNVCGIRLACHREGTMVSRGHRQS